MDLNKPDKTPADYMAIAINPVLIIVMVYSVCFFLVEIFYRGEGLGGVRWVLFWFVLAVVLISRIAMERGEDQAIIYGLALTAAVGMYLLFVHSNIMFATVLLAVVWFLAHKLTSNCTLIDEETDASGQGLLQPLRELATLFKKKPAPAAKTTPPPLPPSAGPAKKKKSRSQAPGIWLIYFSLAAIPTFGLGQTLLPAGDLAARHHAFVYLFLYLAAALGLLITTSFLGLRRYLRQRYVAMPGNIARGWIQTGAIAAVIVLLLALLMPRPGAGAAWMSLRYHVDHQLRRASDFAARFNPHGTGQGRASDQTSGDNQQSDKSPPNGPDSNSNPDANGDGKGPDGQQGGGNSSQGGGGNAQSQGSSQNGTPGQVNGQQGNKDGQSKPPPKPKPADDTGAKEQRGVPGKPTPSGTPPPPAFSWLRILFWLAVLVGLACLAYRYRAVLLAMLRGIWEAIQNFLAALRNLFKSSATKPVAIPRRAQAPPFSSFKNPFLTGGDQLWPPEQLIAYTYDALQSWVLETEAVRGSPKTPREFCRQLGNEIPEADNALKHIAVFYGHVAYGASIPRSYDTAYLRSIWDLMANPRPKPMEAPVLAVEAAGKI